jgi:hypothetical protein
LNKCVDDTDGVLYEDLFLDFGKKNMLLEPVIYNIHKEMNTYSLLRRNESMCEIDLTQHNGVKHFPFLFVERLYERLDDECHIIRIRGNSFFAHYILSREFAGTGDEKLRKIFEYPYRKFVDKIIKPNKHILDIVGNVKKKFHGKKWMALHSRGVCFLLKLAY